jgi:1-deoxy-D-xylulose-5-phosphate reductoisomerase
MGYEIKRVAILGSTGSIGQQALDVIRTFKERFQVVALAGGRNTGLLAKQVREFHPRMYYSKVDAGIGRETEFLSMEDMAGHPEVDLVIIATSGKAGLYPALAALRAGKTLALANKEVLVAAGEVIVREAKRHRARILPIDSEHSAIWQCLRGERNKIWKLYLTASGGPFYSFSQAGLAQVTAEQALQHPVWKMGKKVTIDSSTLMNKGLEVIEARWLFAVPLEKIEVLIHPQSVIHSMVEFVDGSVKAQLAFPDMRLPIQYAMCFPRRLPNPGLPRIDLDRIQHLSFEPVDTGRFPCLRLALYAGKLGGTYPAAMCAADEVAVELFLSRRIRFVDIAALVEEVLESHQSIGNPSMEDIMRADAWARKHAMSVSDHRRSACIEQGEALPRKHLEIAE